MKRFLSIFLLGLAVICASCSNSVQAEKKATPDEKKASQASSKRMNSFPINRITA